MKLKPVEDQVVALMGASSGIGREAALRFAQRGAKVVVAARSEEGLRSLVEEIRANGGEAAAVVADTSDFEETKAVADRAAEEYGRLRRIVEVDLLGQAYGAMVALPRIKREGRGALVHVSSVLARRSVPLQSPYCGSTARTGCSSRCARS